MAPFYFDSLLLKPFSKAVRRLSDQLVDPLPFFFWGERAGELCMNDAVQLSADIFHIPNSGKNLCLRRFAAVKIRRHIVQVTILFGPQAFPNGVLIGKSIFLTVRGVTAS